MVADHGSGSNAHAANLAAPTPSTARPEPSLPDRPPPARRSRWSSWTWATLVVAAALLAVVAVRYERVEVVGTVPVWSCGDAFLIHAGEVTGDGLVTVGDGLPQSAASADPREEAGDLMFVMPDGSRAPEAVTKQRRSHLWGDERWVLVAPDGHSWSSGDGIRTDPTACSVRWTRSLGEP